MNAQSKIKGSDVIIIHVCVFPYYIKKKKTYEQNTVKIVEILFPLKCIVDYTLQTKASPQCPIRFTRFNKI